jgi:Flp pilus assembly protein TadG
MRQADFRAAPRYARRRRRSRGTELIEFTLNFLPFLAMIIVVVDTAWAIFAEATLQQAVRLAVRRGVTLTASQVTGNLTDTVKSLVQQNSVGMLNGTSGLSRIKVNYFDQNNPSVDVSNQAWGNTPGNIMQVSVQNYPLSPLMARIFSWSSNVDKGATGITVYAADIIEPMATSSTPPIGPAP